MIQHAKEDIQAFIDKTWPAPEYLRPNFTSKIRIWPNTDNGVDIEMSQMYAYLDLPFSKLIAISEFFGTKNIADADRSSYSGCETCDHGSKYEWTLNIRPDAI